MATSEIGVLMRSRTGSVLISIIMGLGLASLFRRVCKDNQCRVITGPKLSDIRKHTYRIDDRCYSYKPVATRCTDV